MSFSLLFCELGFAFLRELFTELELLLAPLELLEALAPKLLRFTSLISKLKSSGLLAFCNHCSLLLLSSNSDRRILISLHPQDFKPGLQMQTWHHFFEI